MTLLELLEQWHDAWGIDLDAIHADFPEAAVVSLEFEAPPTGDGFCFPWRHDDHTRRN